ncbi:ABC transporter ATP-binding protein [Gordonia terrae]|uniref:ABC transporter ATP-binding protein n=2 Tax=Gordonia terrae TaxID=2055 RepID=A0AAD0NVT8_9ACTN|nr:ATP-binding cassette domain-containing protein [Gordonia terrae]VTR01990.1 phosphonate-transporting ATPase [Clostridioides difficile]ANY23621.1 ABC transporter ATP-binding protein [Gordonia terrae]AWO84351.1 ABC transporter ATP-binding protein [Gordonia terrae]VTS53298.1 LIV-I protein F [Gordonia terrae]GAB41767.1 putative ABC transporter ATP-binding protein [Gordonia terrae NBRC 100016]
MTLLECRGLDAGYARGKACVHGLDLSVEAGEIVALLGPNGAGKTTLLATLAGLLPRLGGEVNVADQSVRAGEARAAVRAGLVLVPDDRSLFKQLTTRQNLQLAIRRRGAARTEAIDRVLGHFPALRARLKVAAGELSGGEQQMLAIGRALLQQPKVLLIDELSMGLAPIIVESILPVLREVADTDGAAVVLVEQHVRLALDVADRAVVLVHGEIALADSAAALANDIRRVEEAYLGSART